MCFPSWRSFATQIATRRHGNRRNNPVRGQSKRVNLPLCDRRRFSQRSSGGGAIPSMPAARRFPPPWAARACGQRYVVARPQDSHQSRCRARPGVRAQSARLGPLGGNAFRRGRRGACVFLQKRLLRDFTAGATRVHRSPAQRRPRDASSQPHGSGAHTGVWPPLRHAQRFLRDGSRRPAEGTWTYDRPSRADF